MSQVEHIAWQVQDPVTIARWYVENLGFRVVRKVDAAPFTHFIGDASGRVIVEMYHNPAAPLPDYRSMNPLLLHLAFVVDSPEAVRDALVKAGASIAEDVVVTPAGDKLVMLRDPWGFAIQLCKRAKPMI
jgi:catechol-2,3-dioxygenase